MDTVQMFTDMPLTFQGACWRSHKSIEVTMSHTREYGHWLE